MAAKTTKNKPLSFTDIVLNAEAEVIKQAYDARLSVDKLLAERESLYARIAELESEVDEVLGEEGVFPFPAPPVEVAGFNAKASPAKRSKPAAKKAAPKATAVASSKAESEPAKDVESKADDSASE